MLAKLARIVMITKEVIDLCVSTFVRFEEGKLKDFIVHVLSKFGTVSSTVCTAFAGGAYGDEGFDERSLLEETLFAFSVVLILR